MPGDVPTFDIKLPPKRAASAAQRKGTGFIHPNLPQLPCTVLMLGPRKTGKSMTLRNMIDPTRPGSYGHALQDGNVVIYSPTKEYDDTLTSLNLKNIYGPPDDVGMIIEDIKREQERNQLQNNMADVLLILEDCSVVPNAWSYVRTLGYSGRHYGMHTIAIAHKLTLVDRGIRTQQQQWLLFRPHEESERESILESFSAPGDSRKIWRTALYRAWKTPYNFVYIDFERGGDMTSIYRSGFNESLFLPEEMAMLDELERTGFMPNIRPGGVTTADLGPVERPLAIGGASSSSKRKRGQDVSTEPKAKKARANATRKRKLEVEPKTEVKKRKRGRPSKK